MSLNRKEISWSEIDQQNENSISQHFDIRSTYNAPPAPTQPPPPPPPPKLPPQEQVQMHDIAAVARYYAINHPILSTAKQKTIQEKLKLDEQVRGELFVRLKNDEFFVNYNRNPFSFNRQDRIPTPIEALKQEQRIKQRAKPTKERQMIHPPKENIVQAVNQLTKAEFTRQPSIIQRTASHTQISSKMVRSASASLVRQEAAVIGKKAARETIREWTLEEIMAIDEKSFFVAHQGSINIFQIMRGTHRPLLTRQSLDKYFFNFTHLVERIDVPKFPLFRDISRAGRQLAQNLSFPNHQRLDYISSVEMAVRYGEIRLQDLLSMASGRFTPEIAETAANQSDARKDFSPTSSQMSQAEILYQSRLRHQKINCENPQQARHEISAYRYIQNTPEEAKFQKFCARIYSNVKSDMQLKANLVSHTIKDRGMHGKITKTVQENIEYLANLNYRRKSTSTDRLVSQNKMSKNRKETLQIRHLLQSIQLKNREEEKIRKILNPT